MSELKAPTTPNTTIRVQNTDATHLEQIYAYEEESGKVMEKKKDPFKNKDVAITHQGNQIILPESPARMSELKAIEYLQRKVSADEQILGITEEVDCHPLEGAWALKKVLEMRYGWAEATPKIIETPFGPQTIQPRMRTLEVAHKEFEQVIWGQFQLPGVEGKLSCGAVMTRDGLRFVVQGDTKKKYQGEVKTVVDLVRTYVLLHSIYRGKALLLRTDEDGDVDLDEPPSFLDLSRVREDELIFAGELQRQIETSIFTPIEKTAECREHKIPLKRGVLMEGPYGTGKTLTAYVTAKKAVENKWTFIYLDRVSGLQAALEFAKRYFPCVIFAEDIDRVMDGKRDANVDDILNTIDGISSKNCEVMTILTTNKVDGIEKAMLRPGRLDAIVSFTAPDARAAEKLIRTYARGLVEQKENLESAGQELAGQIPAVIREVVERAKLYAISHTKQGEKLKLRGADIADSARSMKRHLSLLEVKPDVETTEKKFAESFKQLVKDSATVTNDTIINKIEKVIEATA